MLWVAWILVVVAFAGSAYEGGLSALGLLTYFILIVGGLLLILKDKPGRAPNVTNDKDQVT